MKGAALPRIRVLIVDDSAVVRRMLSDAFSVDPLLEIAGTAPNGRIALAKIQQVEADVVILDVDMPEVGGLETLAAIRRTHPRLPVILFSALTERGAAVTLEALAMGASDYVTKPSSARGSASVGERIQGELIPRIKALCSVARPPFASGIPPNVSGPSPLPRKLRPAILPRVNVVVIGASTGGPAVLCDFLPRLPSDFPAPILIVQHMPSIFTRLLAERLASICVIGVQEGAPSEVLRPGTARVAPGDFHMLVERTGNLARIRTNQEAPRSSCRPSVDALFESVAMAFGSGTLALVLTGMGQDGLEGSGRIREAGGQVLVQDEQSSVVWGMPGVVARAGLADAIVPRDQIAQEILRRVQAGRGWHPAPRTSIAESHE